VSKSRIERLCEALCNGETVDITPESRVEKYLLSLVCGEKIEDAPQSRVEAYLYALCEKGMGGGSDGSITLPDNAAIYYKGNAADNSIMNFESSAVGVLQEG
jgi:hypothetical protein